MPIYSDDGLITLSGVISVEDAQPLHEWLLANPTGQVNLHEVSHLHTAALQVLIAAQPLITANSEDQFLADALLPLLPITRSAEINYQKV